MKKYKKLFTALFALIFWFAVWFIFSKIIHLDLILPSPVSVIKRLFELMGEKDFYLTVLYSVLRIVVGFVGGMAFGIILSVISFAIPIMKSLISPLISVIKATPVASFIVMVFLFFDKTDIPAFISFLMVVPIAYQNTLSGIESVDKKMLEFAKVYAFSKKDTFLKIYVPSVRGYVATAAATALGLAWKAGVAAEVIANPPLSIGRKILESKTYLESQDLYAWTLSIIVISMLISAVFNKMLKGTKKNAGNNKA